MFKENINKIHYDLSNIENHDFIKIKEKSNLKFGEYIEISMLKENKEFISIIKKSDLEKDNFEWKYIANPNDENSILVERISNIHSFSKDVNDIFEHDRFDSEYEGYSDYDEDFIKDIQDEMKRFYSLSVPKYKVIEFLNNTSVGEKSPIFDTVEREIFLNYIAKEVVGEEIPLYVSDRAEELYWRTFRERMKEFGYKFI